jgi:hypothetical protein
MMGEDKSFYVTGGTLHYSAPSYIERRADAELHEALSAGEFCYVLTSRQMGKSSLMVRTAVRLRQEGVQVAVLDLTALGQNLATAQWYEALLELLGQPLDLEDELEQFWREHPHVPPLRRWMRALREVILARCPGRLVIFIDEIDAVRSVSFSTDEFFAAIRECYNRRTQDPELDRLTFCLLGVARPSDLIRDIRSTPFNIGRRIEPTDFTEEEAASLARGLGGKGRQAGALLKRILYWTGGHPYLTQLLCQAVAEEDGSGLRAQGSGIRTSPTPSPEPCTLCPRDVDRLCEALFLSARAQERSENLLFVRERILRSEADLESLLDLYGRVRSGQRVPVDETNPLVDILRLSGIVRVEPAPPGTPSPPRLQVRNRIYERVFNWKWVTVHMPEAELRRQRAAFRRGLMRAAAVSAVVIAVTVTLALSSRRPPDPRGQEPRRFPARGPSSQGRSARRAEGGARSGPVGAQRGREGSGAGAAGGARRASAAPDGRGRAPRRGTGEPAGPARGARKDRAVVGLLLVRGPGAALERAGRSAIRQPRRTGQGRRDSSHPFAA